MSLKLSIKRREQRAAHPGFELYEDSPETLFDGTEDPSARIYLRLDGVALQLHTLEGGGASVTLTLSRQVARELGLLPALGSDRTA